MGKVLVLILAASALVGGAAMYWLQVYAFYEEVPATGVEDVQVTALSTGLPEPVMHENFKAIDSESSPLRYRACFETDAELAGTHVAYGNPVPNIAPGWFDCFDAKVLGAALEVGEASAYLGTANIVYGFDRVVAVDGRGRGYVWHQINECGEAAYDGDPLPRDCPLPPEVTE